MSGVFGHRLGRKNSRTSVFVSSVRYSVSSFALLRHVKYVYESLNPSFASQYMTLGRVNASDKRMRSRCFFLRSRIIHSQNANGLVWGLSTLKMCTPCSIQNSTMLLSSVQRLRHAGVSKSNG